MKRSIWQVLAYGAILTAVTLPASAQVVIGGSNAPSVEVNWSVLDRLGRQPTLADMLKSEVPVEVPAVAPRSSASKGVQYQPYVSGAKPYAKTSKAAKVAKAKPVKKSSVVPASAKADHMADLVQSSHAAAKPAKAPVSELNEAAKSAAPVMAGPQIALPELPAKPAAAAAARAAPTAVPAPAPVQIAKAEPAPTTKAEPAPVAKVEPPAVPAQLAAESAAKVEAAAKAVPAPLPPAALTPPPLPVAPKVVEAAPVPQQLASLPPAPPPAVAAAASGSRGDTLTVPFAAESAYLSNSVHADLDRLAKRMLKDDSLGLQLLAYADGDEASASKARRLSLSRALEVRKYLMEKGLRSTRIEVRALGNKLEGNGDPDRVDAVLVNR